MLENAMEKDVLELPDVTTEQAARELGVSLKRIYQLIESETLRAKKVLGRWLIDKESLEAHKAERERLERAENQEE